MTEDDSIITFIKILCKKCRKEFEIRDLKPDNNLMLILKTCPFCGTDHNDLCGMGIEEAFRKTFEKNGAMPIITIDENLIVHAIDRGRRTDIIDLEYWEYYTFDDPTPKELDEYEKYLKEQLERIKKIRA